MLLQGIVVAMGKGIIMKFASGLLIALITTFSQVSAYACGDSLYRVGRGVSYRIYSAPLPGNLLVYANSDNSRQLAAQLAESGHNVILVTNSDQMLAEFRNGSYDVVITPFSERAMIESITLADTTFLPLAADRDEAKLAKQSYGQTLAISDSIKRNLKAIHKVLVRKA
jgi:hypothetical protein